ncbi:uncharacterized protein [Nicotiana sylvestris]|uniref:uncharacterized protein n=1 Tax=Nicotiana sylvestris TaxID=4096 RepID=UPI00388CE95D
MASERDTLRGELALTQSLLQCAKEEAHKFKALHAESAAALSAAKSEADALIFSYREDAAAANTQAREISEEAELKLAHALAHARLKSRRQAFKKVHAKGFDLSAEIEEAKALEEESVASTTSDEGSATIPWMPNEVLDLVDWARKLATSLIMMSASGEICRRASRRLSTMAFNKLKPKLLRCEAKLNKALNGEKSLRLLCDKKTKELIHLRSELNRSHDYEGNLEKQFQRKAETLERLWGKANQVNSKCNELKAQIDAHVAAKRNALAKSSALEIQLRNAREGNLVQASRIAKLETDLLKMKVKVVDARAEAKEVRAKADKKVAIYLKDVAGAHTKFRGDLDREMRSNGYVRCRSWRETLEKIHGKGFDLSEEIEQDKANELDAKFLVSDAEDNEEEADEGAGPEGANGDIVPEGGKAKFPRVD